jgi:hypothetical protein
MDLFYNRGMDAEEHKKLVLSALKTIVESEKNSYQKSFAKLNGFYGANNKFSKKIVNKNVKKDLDELTNTL